MLLLRCRQFACCCLLALFDVRHPLLQRIDDHRVGDDVGEQEHGQRHQHAAMLADDAAQQRMPDRHGPALPSSAWV
jgi:hypothetical protein